ncbi:sugar phosphate isomerase/epimerase family protein [Vibrio comitans]|uniref:Sugar phosphate isomerase n=1 Tax=Vibrio comitans NBRC 102076 TaxID=1219078 RepID=A0A4Y3INV0_9VIBR|nr:sugar phosphate isomerase/epimerase [Vibrio comitans]GEA61183.1 sugar phosphate isomerase [Vibrio comitans NBRC 102076]
MSKPQIAVQMMMLAGKVKELGVYETLKTLKEMGFNAVEISQVDMSEENVAEMERAVYELEMNICSLSAYTAQIHPSFPVDSFDLHFDKIVSDAKRLDVSYLRIGSLPFTHYGQPEKFIEFAKEMDMWGAKLREYGIKLFYHNHHCEFDKVDGKVLFEHLVENTSAENIGFEIDVHWIQRAGLNPAKFIKKMAGRAELVHLKDYRIATPSQEDLMGSLAKGDMNLFFNTIQFAEIGEGNLDFKEIIDACEESNVRYLPIEQDDTYGRDPFESLQISMDNLKKMGYADYF